MVISYRFGSAIKFSNYGINKNYFKIKSSRFYSEQVLKDGKTNSASFMDMLQMRRAQASKSVLVQVQSAQSYKELYSYCRSLGDVKNMLHYKEGAEEMHFIIVEFSSEDDVKKVLAASTHIKETQTIPVHSQFLWFRAANRKLGKLKEHKSAKLLVENGSKIITEDNLRSALSRCNTISAQIQELYLLTRLNDIGQRLRFLTAKQIETTVSGLFPNVCAYPFGSSVNGFGKMGCDLDLVLRLTHDQEKEESRLIYHCKAASGSERNVSQRNMEALGDLINLFLPGCTQVRRILQARVPIIKYYQQLANIECDLSMTNMSGVYMSDFLYIMGEIDERVRPLVFTIRKWAREVHLTNAAPGRWITNFSLTLLVLSFLQKPLYSQPVLPTLNTLVKLAGTNDQFITEDGINCTFLRDIQRLNFKSENTRSLEELLLEFFEYYSQFNFDTKAVCLNEAVSITKPEHCPLYIVNPLERGLNVSKNVSYEELERFKVEVRNAAWILESKDASELKGLLQIFHSNNTNHKLNFLNPTKHNRMIHVKNLFEQDDSPEVDIDFKNKTLEKEIVDIKKKTKQTIKALDFVERKRKTR